MGSAIADTGVGDSGGLCVESCEMGIKVMEREGGSECENGCVRASSGEGGHD